jgi:hypothetical protein
LGESFFHNSYVLKYPGIPLDCKKCKQDLVFHQSYHFEFHETCRFCKLTLYKLRATTEEEHYRLEEEKKPSITRLFALTVTSDSVNHMMPRNTLTLNMNKSVFHSNVIIVKAYFNLTKPNNIMR